MRDRAASVLSRKLRLAAFENHQSVETFLHEHIFVVGVGSLRKWGSTPTKTASITAYPDCSAARELLQKIAIQPTVQHEPPLGGIDPDKNSSNLSNAGTTATGKTSTRNSKLRLSRVSQFFSHCLTTIPVSKGPSARRSNCIEKAQRGRQPGNPFPRLRPCWSKARSLP